VLIWLHAKPRMLPNSAFCILQSKRIIWWCSDTSSMCSSSLCRLSKTVRCLVTSRKTSFVARLLFFFLKNFLILFYSSRKIWKKNGRKECWYLSMWEFSDWNTLYFALNKMIKSHKMIKSRLWCTIRYYSSMMKSRFVIFAEIKIQRILDWFFAH
jgi:hypothetical protein